MNKDVIYIDVEDDITAIIGKIKASSEKIVALVPPKHVGALQSAVNLRLLQRMAANANKRMVLITNNQALIGLSAAAGIPVAKNLQSKPEIAEIPVLRVDDGDDIIDGAQLPIGELEKTADVADDGNASVNKAIETLNIDDKPIAIAALGSAVAKKFNKGKSGTKVPNFNTFRKKLFIGIGASLFLILFFVWATWLAPAAKVIITARTTAASVNTTATLGGNAATDVAKGAIQSTFQQTKKDSTIDFDATGQKNIGDKATGVVKFSQQSLNTAQIPAGTQLTTSDELVFTTDAAVTVPASSIGGPGCFPTACAGTTTVDVTAAAGGADYNGASGNLTGSIGNVSASFSGSSSGGTDKIATVVTAGDVQTASQKLVEQSSDDIKKQLIRQFAADEVVIDDSFTIDRAAAVSAPAVGEVATGKARLTSSATYTMSAVAKSDLEIYLKANLEKQLVGKTDQRIYDNGIKKVKLSGYVKTGDVSTVKIISTGQIGPRIDEAQIKEQVKGKIYGEVQSTLEMIDGVSKVDVQFSFFWVRTVPDDADKITVEFKLENE